MAEAIRGFRGVAHRLEAVRERAGVTWVNDSIATAPERMLAALRSYDAPLILLAGGRDKQLPWEEALRVALRKARCIISFGDFGAQIEALGRSLGGEDARVCCVADLGEAVALAASVARAGDVVLLSRGARVTTRTAISRSAARISGSWCGRCRGRVGRPGRTIWPRGAYRRSWRRRAWR